jgi:hypothetical protein
MLEIPFDTYYGKATTTPTQHVKFIKDWLSSNRDLLGRTLEDGCTHLRARRVGDSLIVDAFRIVPEERNATWTKPDPVLANCSIWFMKSMGGLYHAMPPVGEIPRPALTAISHPF